jgi:hypothetical protein
VSETETTTSEPAAGWYTDPGGSGALRWWAGTGWTEHLAPIPEPEPLPVPVAALPASLEPWAPTEKSLGLFAPIAPPIDDWPPHATTVSSITPSADTRPIWLMATVVAAVVGCRGAVSSLRFDSTLVVTLLVSLAILAALITLAFWDHSVLASRRLKAASGWWILLLPPIGYLIARRVVLKRQGIRANAPSNVYVLTAVAVWVLTFFALTPLADAQRDDASLRLLEQQSSTELLRQTSVAWTTTCPDEAPASVVGSTFECTAADTTGRSVRFTAHVVRPHEFSVDAPVLQ